MTGMLDRVLAAYARAPDHPGKLRIFDGAVRLFGRRGIAVRNAFGLMELNPNDLVQREILLRGGYELQTLELVRRLLRPGDTFVDIGAHVGQFAFAAAQVVGGAGRVIAVEPGPEACAALLRNRALTRPAARFDVVCAALSDSERFVPFGVVSNHNIGTMRMVASDRSDAVHCATVPYAKLASALAVGPVRVAKIDVEGAEFLVLRGFQGLERSLWPDHILMEYIPHAFDYFASPQALVAFLRESGYVLRDIEGVAYAEDRELPEFNLWASKAELAD